jgi:hypothetical protein
MNIQEQYQQMQEEIDSTTNPVHKDMLLQKYGLIPVKLTQAEKRLIRQQAIIYYTIREVA